MQPPHDVGAGSVYFLSLQNRAIVADGCNALTSTGFKIRALVKIQDLFICAQFFHRLMIDPSFSFYNVILWRKSPAHCFEMSMLCAATLQ